MENGPRSEVLISVAPQQAVQEIVMQLQQFTLQEGSHFDWLLMHAFCLTPALSPESLILGQALSSGCYYG